MVARMVALFRLPLGGQRGRPPHQPSPSHPLLWWGMDSTVLGKHSLDQHPEPHSTSSRALNACELTCVNPICDGGPTRSASLRTEVNKVLIISRLLTQA